GARAQLEASRPPPSPAMVVSGPVPVKFPPCGRRLRFARPDRPAAVTPLARQLAAAAVAVAPHIGRHLPVTEPVHVPSSWARETSMTDFALPGSIEPARRRGPDLDRGFHPASAIIFLRRVAAGLRL